MDKILISTTEYLDLYAYGEEKDVEIFNVWFSEFAKDNEDKAILYLGDCNRHNCKFECKPKNLIGFIFSMFLNRHMKRLRIHH